ncbi:lysophospholipid acyltransferase family protein [Streptomyces sp. NPDC048636]|uniref:lysophospholipid acyltransferase family protein n=1 Tax=Streptomyces sp. NPDC048636 TaxID=3155762 RepID=UPI00342C6F54
MTVSAPLNPPAHAWAAWSPCDPGCVSHATGRIPATRTLRRTAAFGRALVGALTRGERIAEPETLRSTAAGLLTALGIRLEVAGDATLSAPGATGTLVVANHISWLDIVALLAVEPVVMLAKREVGDWPVVGPMTGRAGTMFLDRASLRQLPDAVREMSDRLRDGQSVVVFPQGITWCAGTGGSFRRATFQAAIDAGAPVRPVALEYLQHSVPTTVAAFVGEDDFGSSLRRVLRADGLTIRVRNHRPLLPVPGKDDRRTLAARAQATVDGARRPPHS